MYRLQIHVFIMSGTIQAHVCVLGVLLQTFNFIIRSNGSPEKHTCGEECVRVLGFLSVGAANHGLWREWNMDGIIWKSFKSQAEISGLA